LTAVARPIAYADRRRTAATPAMREPRNTRAAQWAREQELPLVVSFVGDTPWSNPTVYCDSGVRYAWDFMAGLHAVLVVKPGVDARHAMREILMRSDLIRVGYPVLVDVESQEVACIVDGNPVGLWQVRHGSELWQHYLKPAT
jgi:hypothetical protein